MKSKTQIIEDLVRTDPYLVLPQKLFKKDFDGLPQDYIRTDIVLSAMEEYHRQMMEAIFKELKKRV